MCYIHHNAVFIHPLNHAKCFIHNTMYTFCINFKGTHVEFLDHIHNYLAINMDSEAVCHLMLSTELISDGTTLASSSNYQTNLLLLERIRKMNAQQFKSFCELLVNSASQKHLGQFLEQGQ